MPNDFIINDNIYLVLLRYFEGDIVNINKKTINSLKKGKFNKKEIKPIDKKVIKKLKQILTLEEENPEDYANINWVYPEWSKDQDMVLKKLKEEFPEDYRTEEEPTSEEEKEVSTCIIFPIIPLTICSSALDISGFQLNP